MLAEWTAWPVVTLAGILIGCDAYYLRRHPGSVKRYLRIFGIIAAGYVMFIYALIGLGFVPVGNFGALLARVAQHMLLMLLIAESIGEYKP